MASRLDIKDMREIAQLKGGKCLSKEFIDQYAPLKWMCEKGHTWDAGYYLIRQGGWCVQCARNETNEKKLGLYKKIAEKRGGKCLSLKYIDSHTKLTWQCREKHIWDAQPHQVRFNKRWCPFCAGNVRRTLSDMQKVAEKRKGACLSLKYINNHTNLKWQCSKGHQWNAKPHNVVASLSWCPVCAGKAKHTIEKMHQLAKAKGGVCLSSKYFNRSTKLKWQCAKKHIWKSNPENIVQGEWCQLCGYESNSRKQRTPISEVKKTARERGGKLLSESYINSTQSLKWQCSKGHTWTARYTDIKHHHSWCPLCYKEKRKPLPILIKKKWQRVST